MLLLIEDRTQCCFIKRTRQSAATRGGQDTVLIIKQDKTSSLPLEIGLVKARVLNLENG